ncbi:acetate uptake transporter [Streptomyces sp. NBC_01267]|uniref:acetate uptake transporter n=1 Tax=unclassified Streptomyces TaxID=2593676 RepID=UPI002025B33C|nr:MULTISPECIES: acetate uptake transporter [unclassified Streptomyces]MCX4553624.1 acetate uptake transporter [Streptomyces sp. NBC_01500]WSV52613.1 acetate uptake transporter [Streptomyces sp. NBC_01014]
MVATKEELGSQSPPGATPAAGTRVADSPHIADPGALGLGAFAMTTFVLSVFNAGLINVSVEAVVLPIAFFYGGIVQLLAGMWEFRRGNTFAATAFASYGAFWLTFAGFITRIAPHLSPTHAYQALGVYLLAWAIFTAYMMLAALRVNVAVLGVFVALTVTFVLLTIGAFGQSSSMDKAGGWAGLVTAAIAWYASFAYVTNNTWKKTLLPVGSLRR